MNECGWCITSRHKVCHFPAWCDCRKATQQGDWGASCETMEATTKTAPGGAQTPLLQGPRRLNRSRLMPIIVPASSPRVCGVT